MSAWVRIDGDDGCGTTWQIATEAPGVGELLETLHEALRELATDPDVTTEPDPAPAESVSERLH